MHRHLPKYIVNAKKRKQEQVVSKYNKKINKEANTGIKQKVIPDKYKAVDKMEFEEQREISEKRVRKAKKHNTKV